MINVPLLSGEPVVDVSEGRPMLVRTPGASLSFANFARSIVSGAIASLRLGMQILEREGVRIDGVMGHGGFFKTPETGQRMMSAALKTPVSVMATSGEGGAWGMAILAAYRVEKEKNQSLESFLDERVFAGAEIKTLQPVPADVEGFDRYVEKFTQALKAERTAVDCIR